MADPANAGVSVRVAGGADADVAELANLRRAWNEERAGGPIDDPAFEAAFRSWWEAERATRTFFLAEVGGAPVGMANVMRFERMPAAGRPAGSWGYVGNVFVLAQHRDEGIGQRLMDAVITWARDAGLVVLRLAPSERSWPFYGRLGFTAGKVVDLPLHD